MKAFISGKTCCVEQHQNAELLLNNIGIDPFNPLSIISQNNLIDRIKSLLECDAILLLDGWLENQDSRIEKEIAQEKGKIILFESKIIDHNKQIEKVKDAIYEVIGLRYDQYVTKNRMRDTFYARMIIVNYCLKVQNMTLEEIGKIINRDYSTVIHCKKTYQNEIVYNKKFRSMVNKIDKILNKNVLY